MPRPFLPKRAPLLQKRACLALRSRLGWEITFELRLHDATQFRPKTLTSFVQKPSQKIRSTIHAIGMDPSLFPDPEPHCNCPHCQIAKAILPTSEESAPLEGEEEISEEDL